MADDPMMYVIAGCYYARGASGVDKFRKTMSIADAVLKSVENARMEIMKVEAEAVRSNVGSTVGCSLISAMLVCVASIGAKWAAENPAK